MENLSIDKQNGTVAFNEEVHRYWDVNDPSIKFTSVTTMIEQFGQPFDRNFGQHIKLQRNYYLLMNLRLRRSLF